MSKNKKKIPLESGEITELFIGLKFKIYLKCSYSTSYKIVDKYI